MHDQFSASTTAHSTSFARHLGRVCILTTIVTGLCASASGGCGGGDMGVTDGGGPGDTDGGPAVVPGYVVDCTPEVQGDPMVCITKDDWDCSQRGFYVRESICALVLNGTPSEYDGKPQMSTIDLDGDGPQMPVGDIDCVNLPDGVLSGYQGLSSCDDCRVCGNQLQGYNSIGFGKGYGWDDLAFCPGSYEDLGAPGGLCVDGDDEPTPTTSAGDDGGGDSEGLWKCTGSSTIKGTMIDTDIQTQTEVSMSGPTPDCVNAMDAMDALESCIDLCEYKDGSYAQEAANSDSKNWQSFPCADLGNFTPLEAADANECSGGGPMWMTLPSPFTATATLTVGGATAQSDQLSGLMDFTIGKCPGRGAPCDVSITELRVGPRTVHGLYRDAEASTAHFTVADLELDLLQPVLGEMDPATGVVRFPGKDLFASISAGSTALDGKPLSEGVERALFIVEGAEGTWDGRQLTLDLRWIGAGMSLSLELSAG